MTQKLSSSTSLPVLPSSPVVKQPGEESKGPSSATDQKTQQVFIGKKPAAVQRGGDSDEELAAPMEKMTIFKRNTSISVDVMTIQCRDEKGEVKNIKGSTLIEIVHDKIQYMYDEAIALASTYERELDGPIISAPKEESGIISIHRTGDWIMTLGGWKGMMPSQEVKDYFFWFSESKRKFNGVMVFKSGVTFPIVEGRLHITKGFTIAGYNVTTARKKTNERWGTVYKTDLSYIQIRDAIAHIKTSFKLTDSDLATLQLCAFNNMEKAPQRVWKETPERNQKEILLFLDYLNCLMFGIEASGLNAAIVISLMTLDLIKDGHQDYTTAFKANEDGGFYPYACFGDNRGTYNKREEILLHRKAKRESKSMKEFRENPSLSPVANKEAMLIREWLRLNQVFTGEKLYDIQFEEIERAVDDILDRYLSPGIRKGSPFRKGWLLKKFEQENNQYRIEEEKRLKSRLQSLSAKK